MKQLKQKPIQLRGNNMHQIVEKLTS